MNKLALLLLFVFSTKAALSQNKTPLLEKKVSIEAKTVSSQALLQIISVQTGIIFAYNPDILKDIKPVSISVGNKSVRSILRQSLGESIQLSERGKYVILKKEKSQSKKRFIEGYVSEPITGKNIGQATVYDKNTYASAITNQYGYFKIEVPESDSSQNVLMVSKNGQSDTVTVLKSNEAQFIEAEFRPIPKDSIAKDSTITHTNSSGEELIPQWLVSKDVFVNTFNLSDTFFKQINFSVLPYVSTNRLLTGNSANNIAMNLTIGYCREIRVAEFGLILNIVRDNVRHVQLAGVGNIVGGKMLGYQAAGIFNLAQTLVGIQYASVLNLSKDVKGIQIASVFNRSISVTGVQITGFYNKTSTIQGAQVSSFINKADSVSGAQITGIINIAKSVRGCQVAAMINVANEVDSVQIAGFLNLARANSGIQVACFMNKSKSKNRMQISGFLNCAKASERLQLSAFMNVTGKSEGWQIAPLNFSDTCEGLPIGVLSVVRKGVHNLELSVDESMFTSLAFRTGVKKFYNIFDLGTSFKSSTSRIWFVGYGLGTSMQLSPENNFFAEIEGRAMIRENNFSNNLSLYKISTGFNYTLTHKISLTGALSFNFVVTQRNSSSQQSMLKDIAPYVLYKSSTNANNQLSSWLGASIGIRFF